MENRLDGNAAGGILRAIFPFEMTLAQTICEGCGMENAVGALAAYISEMGTVLRCPSCDTVLLRVTRIKAYYQLDMRGIRVLQISAET